MATEGSDIERSEVEDGELPTCQYRTRRPWTESESIVLFWMDHRRLASLEPMTSLANSGRCIHLCTLVLQLCLDLVK
jgi:hypothetical protein